MMSFGAQSLDGFVNAKIVASELLREEGLKARGEVSFEEALTMQVISNLLTARDTFYGLEIVRNTDRKSGTVYPILNKFEDPYGLTVGVLEDPTIAHAQDRPSRREYHATGFGRTIFGLFIPAK